MKNSKPPKSRGGAVLAVWKNYKPEMICHALESLAHKYRIIRATVITQKIV